MNSKVLKSKQAGAAWNPQTLSVLQEPEALLRVQTVSQVTGLSAATIGRKVAVSAFPKPIRLSPRCKRWKATDVRAWIAAQGQPEQVAA